MNKIKKITINSVEYYFILYSLLSCRRVRPCAVGSKCPILNKCKTYAKENNKTLCYALEHKLANIRIPKNKKIVIKLIPAEIKLLKHITYKTVKTNTGYIKKLYRELYKELSAKLK